jgi:hypothetical protein
MNSTDGTQDILESRRSADLSIMRVNDLTIESREEFQRIYGAAVASALAANADWLLFQDADEYWIPATGNLKECTALEDANMLSVDRFHMPLVRGAVIEYPPIPPDRYGRLDLVVKSVPNFRDFMRKNPTASWILGIPVRKVMVRPSLVASVTQGGHDAVAIDGHLFERSVPADLLIAHLPFTTRDRFARKVANIRRNIEIHDNAYWGNIAWHWRRWIALADKEGISAEFERSGFDSAAIEILRLQGIVQSVAKIFNERIARW